MERRPSGPRTLCHRAGGAGVTAGRSGGLGAVLSNCSDQFEGGGTGGTREGQPPIQLPSARAQPAYQCMVLLLYMYRLGGDMRGLKNAAVPAVQGRHAIPRRHWQRGRSGARSVNERSRA